MDINLALALFVRRNNSSVFQGLIINLYQIGSTSKIVDTIKVSILPNSPQTEGKDIMLINLLIKAFMIQGRPGGVPILGVETGYAQPIGFEAWIKELFPKLFNYGAIKEDMN